MTTSSTPAVRTQLHEALQTIETRLSAMKKITEGQMRTNGNFKFNPQSQQAPTIPIDKVTDLSLLISIHAFLTTKKKEYEESAKLLDLSSFPVFKWQHHSYEDWDNDIRIRVAVVSHHTEKQKLHEAKEKLSRFLTEEDQMQLTLKELGFNS